MLRQATEAGIPSLLFSATLSSQSGRARGLGRWASRVVFNHLSEIFCVTNEDREVFSELGFADRTKIAGDTRYDQVMERLRNPKPIKDGLFSDQSYDDILVAGSSWPEDETVLTELMILNPELRLVLVPHEPTESHISSLTGQLAEKKITWVRYSQAAAWPKEARILIVDQIGILAELYEKGRFAFVGGSFRKTVHSVMEPLAAGSLTFVGPLHTNNREALEFRTVPIGKGHTTQLCPGRCECARSSRTISRKRARCPLPTRKPQVFLFESKFKSAAENPLPSSIGF